MTLTRACVVGIGLQASIREWESSGEVVEGHWGGKGMGFRSGWGGRREKRGSVVMRGKYGKSKALATALGSGSIGAFWRAPIVL